jgi:hypothetical protein
MIILNPADPAVEIVSSGINAITQEAVEWFDTVRSVESLACTQFTFVVSRLVDRRERYEVVDGQQTCFVEWHRRESRSYSYSQGGGAAYDAAVNSLGARSFLEMDPSFPRQPTATLSLAEIFSVEQLTSEILLMLKESSPQLVENVKLRVELFDINENSLNTNEWTHK